MKWGNALEHTTVTGDDQGEVGGPGILLQLHIVENTVGQIPSQIISVRLKVKLQSFIAKRFQSG
jgi:hypothetical protein